MTLVSRKPQRVRTGCLTCRKRHLKCDETKPTCRKCHKSGLICERGLRISFDETRNRVCRPEITLLLTGAIEFNDESRDIADGYSGGRESYELADRKREPAYHIDNGMLSPATSARLTPPPQREYLSQPEELQYMQAGIKAIGRWMDAFDTDGRFSQLMPHMALESPALRNALLAFGARQANFLLAETYYETAKAQLADDPEPGCAAAVLDVYETSTGKPSTTISVSSTGFWLHVVVRVLKCLTLNETTPWDPDTWGVDMNYSSKPDDAPGNGHDEIWVRRILYILASISNFRAESTACKLEDDVVKLGVRLPRWQKLKRMCDSWENATPRTMHPLGYLDTSPGSRFPTIWLNKRYAVLGRLLYHVAQCLLAQTNPTASDDAQKLQLHHARQMCGIVAHCGRYMAPVATCALTMADAVLEDVAEKVEVEELLRKNVNALFGGSRKNACRS